MGDDVINAVVGMPVVIRWWVRDLGGTGDQYKVFHMTSGTKQLLYGTDVANNSLTGVSLMLPISPCLSSEENRVPTDYRLSFDSVDYAHAGVYSLSVVLFDAMGNNSSFTSSVTLNGK